MVQSGIVFMVKWSFLRGGAILGAGKDDELVVVFWAYIIKESVCGWMDFKGFVKHMWNLF